MNIGLEKVRNGQIGFLGNQIYVQNYNLQIEELIVDYIMSMKNVIKRCGIVFILGPVFMFCLLINLILWFTCIIWGPIYYIITGNDPINFDTFLDFANYFKDWYLEKFGPDE